MHEVRPWACAYLKKPSVHTRECGYKRTGDGPDTERGIESEAWCSQPAGWTLHRSTLWGRGDAVHACCSCMCKYRRRGSPAPRDLPELSTAHYNQPCHISRRLLGAIALRTLRVYWVNRTPHSTTLRSCPSLLRTCSASRVQTRMPERVATPCPEASSQSPDSYQHAGL